MKLFAATVAIGISLVLAFWLALNVIAVIAVRGVSAIPREIFATWPHNLIFGIVATLALAFFLGGIAIITHRERKS